jgi:poly(3-hydroxybutyrate) depolymerase
MKKVYLLGLAISSAIAVQAQDCSNGRYNTEIFNDFDLTSDIQYGSNVSYNNGGTENLFLDVYEPTGDTDTGRPLLIFIHGGTFIAGDKTEADVKPLAEMYARKGYVTSSINYRLGMNNLLSGPDESDASEAVMRATQDARSVVRFFKKSFAEDGNPYGIDTSHIYLVGSSAGGFTALHLAYMDKPSEIPAYINMSDPSLTGGLEGTSGTPGYNSDVNAIVNISGALGDVAWIESANDEPVLSLHGDQDGTVPFGTDIISVAIYDIMEVDGSETVHAKAETLGLKNCFKAEYGADHVPHLNNAAYTDTIDLYVTQWLLSFVCGDAEYCKCNTPEDPTACHVGPTSALSEYVKDDAALNTYPNPAYNDLNVYANGENIENIEVTNINGQIVYQKLVFDTGHKIDVSGFTEGIYFVKVSTTIGIQTNKIIVR